MMLRPTLQVRRLRVLKGGAAVYDESFHAGANIIRGGNSTGKSSVMDLLFFGLGGDFTAWQPEPGSCDTVIVEAWFNGESAVLRRDITAKKGQPMWIFYGAMDDALTTTDGWMRYGFARSDDRESYSQALFRLLDLPDIMAADESNLTMHQLLRILYVDQLTPVTRIFRFEHFDTPQRRQAVGDLMLGAYDGRIYSLQLALRDKEREFDKISGDLSNLYRVLGRSGESLTLEYIEEVESNLRSKLAQIEARIEELRRADARSLEIAKELHSGIIDTLRGDIAKLSNQIDKLRSEVSELEFSIEDSKNLVKELSKNLRQLSDGHATGVALGGLSFAFCPACYALVEESDGEACHLCKTPFEGFGSREPVRPGPVPD